MPLYLDQRCWWGTSMPALGASDCDDWVQAYVCYRPEDRTAIFAFRGTTPQQRMDWAADLNLKKVELPQSLQLADRGILLHQGKEGV